MSKYEDHNNSDYEEDLEQEQIEQEYEKIKHFTQEDYMKCPQTRDILIEDFESRFQETAEDELRELFINNYQSLAYKFSSVLYRADESHAEDFISMIHHHIEKKYNTDIIGISRDSIKSHENFKLKQSFPFELLSDADEKVCKAFDVMKLKSMYGKEYVGVDRSTFIINEKGEVVREWRSVKVKGHVDEVLEAVKELT